MLSELKCSRCSLLKFVLLSTILLSFPTSDHNKAMKIQNGNVPRVFRAGHQNLGRGRLINKINEVHNIFYERSPHLLSISETEMCPEAITSLNNDGYQVETKADNNRISVIISNEINYTRRADLETPYFGIVWIQMGTGKNKTLVGSVYREWKYPRSMNHLPNSTNDPNDQLERWKQFIADWSRILQTEDCEIHLFGDVNLNREKWRQLGNVPDPNTVKLVDLLYEEIFALGVLQTITEPTRVANTVNGVIFSVLDLHFVNDAENLKKVEVSRIANSDHSYIEFQRSGVKQFAVPNYTKRRQWKKID